MRDDPTTDPKPLNPAAVAGLVVCVALAVGALFALPVLRDAGLSFTEAFWSLAGVELLTAFGAGYAVLNLRRGPD
jgi:hypothetical protein